MRSKNELTHKNVGFTLQDQTSKHLQKRGHCAAVSVLYKEGRQKAGAAETSRSALVTCTPYVVTACDICYVAGARRVCCTTWCVCTNKRPPALEKFGEMNNK